MESKATYKINNNVNDLPSHEYCQKWLEEKKGDLHIQKIVVMLSQKQIQNQTPPISKTHGVSPTHMFKFDPTLDSGFNKTLSTNMEDRDPVTGKSTL